jgi:hypothetical protein
VTFPVAGSEEGDGANRTRLGGGNPSEGASVGDWSAAAGPRRSLTSGVHSIGVPGSRPVTGRHGAP